MNQEIVNKYRPTIGIECHVQLKTLTKLFSGADNDAREAAPNTKVSPICFGLPGTLPVLNAEAIRLAIRAGVALNAEIANISSFDRKHYFYPDLPKGYQITQLERPIVGKGEVRVPLPDGEEFTVRITRAHLEEDAGKLTHPSGSNYSLVDLNRAGTPLLEIVSEPDMHSPEEAKAYAQELYLLMKFANVTEGNLYYGNMRFDVNISIAPVDSDELGTRAEIKNLNSFRSIEKAVVYEIRRQAELLEHGEKVIQQTRGWDDAKQATFAQRSKEEAQDYRYFPDADIPPVEVTDEQIAEAKSELSGKLPVNIREQLRSRGIPPRDVATLFTYPLLLNRLLDIADKADDKVIKQVSDLMINVLPAEFEKIDPSIDISEHSAALRPSEHLLELVKIVNDGVISSSSAKQLIAANWHDFTEDPEALAKAAGLVQIGDENAVRDIVREILGEEASQKAIEDIKGGNDRAIGYLVGQVMKRSNGQANPALATKLIREEI